MLFHFLCVHTKQWSDIYTIISHYEQMIYIYGWTIYINLSKLRESSNDKENLIQYKSRRNRYDINFHKMENTLHLFWLHADILIII